MAATQTQTPASEQQLSYLNDLKAKVLATLERTSSPDRAMLCTMMRVTIEQMPTPTLAQSASTLIDVLRDLATGMALPSRGDAARLMNVYTKVWPKRAETLAATIKAALEAEAQ